MNVKLEIFLTCHLDEISHFCVAYFLACKHLSAKLLNNSAKETFLHSFANELRVYNINLKILYCFQNGIPKLVFEIFKLLNFGTP